MKTTKKTNKEKVILTHIDGKKEELSVKQFNKKLKNHPFLAGVDLPKITTHGNTSENLTTREIEKLNKRDYKIWLQGYDVGAKDQAKVFEKKLDFEKAIDDYWEKSKKWEMESEIDVPNIKEWNVSEQCEDAWYRGRTFGMLIGCAVAVFFGVIGGMIISTPHIISALDACK